MPSGSPGFSPGIDETPQVTEISGSVAVFKAKTGQCALGPSLGCPGEQLIEVLGAQVQDVIRLGVGGFFCHGISKSKKPALVQNQAGCYERVEYWGWIYTTAGKMGITRFLDTFGAG
jgi:hypothetical protein